MTARESDLAELARAVDDQASAVAGVVAVYRTAPVADRIAELGSALLGAASDRPRSQVERVDGALQVAVVIGVSGPASETCRRVHDTVLGHLTAVGEPVASVTVTVAHVIGA